MKIVFRVHNVNPSEKPAEVQFQGENVGAMIKCTEVELVGVEGLHGSFTARFTGAEADEALEKFTPDEEITWTL